MLLFKQGLVDVFSVRDEWKQIKPIKHRAFQVIAMQVVRRWNELMRKFGAERKKDIISSD